MNIPGFAAESALAPSTRSYANFGFSAGSRWLSSVSPQQGEDSNCCGKRCPDRCYCEGGIGFCTVTPMEPFRHARAARGIDVCTSGDGTDTAICSCGCVAGPHYAHCLECHQEA